MPPTPPPSPENTGVSVPSDTLHTIASLLIKIPNIEVVKQVCLNDLRVPAETLDTAIREARVLLTRAADYNRDEEFGKAITALNELYSLNLKQKEYKAALAVRKELNTMLQLKYVAESTAGKSSEASELMCEELETIRSYLEPLELSDDPNTPTVELARLAAFELVNKE